MMASSSVESCMRATRSGLVALTLLAACSQAPVSRQSSRNPYPDVLFETSMGSFVVQLDRQRAPLTVANFLHYAASGFYTGTIFHRIVPGFVIQGGGFTSSYMEKKTGVPIPNESGNGLSNLRGTLAMAREGDPHSATAQFYINLADNKKLDPRPDRWGYAVFGQVIQGMDVVDRIASVPTGKMGPFAEDAPLQPVIIIRVLALNTSRD